MSHAIHIVTHFSGVGDVEEHAQTLARMLARFSAVTLWANTPTQSAEKLRAVVISPFSGRMPRGGTLILLGTHFQPGIWLDYAKPERLIVICTHHKATQTFASLTSLQRPGLPKVELAFASHWLQQMLGLPGVLGCELTDLARFKPAHRLRGVPFTIGRHRGAFAEQHHRDDLSLYRMLAWSGVRTHLLGMSCLMPALRDVPEISITATEAISAESFLNGLDCFFYRSDPSTPDATGTAIMEALASGLPVVAHASGAYVDWIKQGENGYLFSDQEEAFDLLMSLKEMSEKRHQMALAARTNAERLAGIEKQESYLRWLSA